MNQLGNPSMKPLVRRPSSARPKDGTQRTHKLAISTDESQSKLINTIVSPSNQPRIRENHSTRNIRQIRNSNQDINSLVYDKNTQLQRLYSDRTLPNVPKEQITKTKSRGKTIEKLNKEIVNITEQKAELKSEIRKHLDLYMEFIDLIGQGRLNDNDRKTLLAKVRILFSQNDQAQQTSKQLKSPYSIKLKKKGNGKRSSTKRKRSIDYANENVIDSLWSVFGRASKLLENFPSKDGQ